ncbi:glycosyl transferase family 2 [Halopolyspora algeriensis]|uniref:Glycosyl transferase family 2 n=1 Tax=Halopolyspora algeriensis TaxID=1500506 RepID=A0A368VQ98_9ACTN|nr:glycosyltransferase family 2 protein [Halopolyspora algeriensis]RCW43720.1 glycosyl transferase family 2 [Halopolyspora algeriensis]TQM47497.1 glycosyl transferase family 2 [Halopolyspora algeriensis]
MLGAAVLGSVYRSVRTIRKARTILPLHEAPSTTVLPPTVTVVVPARNEEAVLDECLRGLRSQTYASRGGGSAEPSGHDPTLRIMVVDDGSTDATGDIARAHAEADPRVRVVRSEGPPPGWSGKVHAMHVGVEAAGQPEPGEWLLFVDADTVLAPELLSRLLETAERADADLVSTPGGPPAEHSASWPVLMPAGLQMIGENADPAGRGRKAFAIGHCILLRRSHYEKVGGWSALASRRNEDVAIATSVRDHGGTTRIIDGLDHVTTSGMDPFGQGWVSFRKSFVAGTQGSLPVLLGGGLGQVALSLSAPAAALAGVRHRRPLLVAVGLAGWAAQGAAHTRTARVMRAGTSLAPLAPFTNALFGGVLLDGAVQVLRRATEWKGRSTWF